MYSRKSRQLRILLRQASMRNASTAAALQPSRTALIEPTDRDTRGAEAGPSHRPENGLGKWSRPSSSSSTTPQRRYQPNVTKWVRPESSQPQRSNLDGINSRSSRYLGEYPRKRNEEPRAKFGLKQSSQSSIRSTTQNDQRIRRSGTENRETNNFVREKVPRIGGSASSEKALSPGSQTSSRIQEVREEERSDRAPAHSRARASYIDDFMPPNRYEAERGLKRSQRADFKSRGSLVERLKLNVGDEILQESVVLPEREDLTKKYKKRNHVSTPQLPDVFIPSLISVGNLARLLDMRLEKLQRCMTRNGMEEQSSYDHMLSADDASLLVMEFNKNPVVSNEDAFDIFPSPPHPDYSSLPRRPPVVTIMGHVDHGKTTLLDTLRSSSVAQGEAGGITQHIGAFSVPVAGTSGDAPKSITFLDTPGHAAFSAMRARGAQATDIIVLVVAADDGVMPQTKEVIQLIKKETGKVGVVVAINKVDKPGADIDKVMNALWTEGMELEAMGGEVPSVEVSGLTGHGLDNLLETISLVTDLQDIRSEPEGPVHGYVLESNVVKGLGNVATILVQRGKLTPASHIISGTTCAKVRRICDSSGATLKSASPGQAVTVSGWKELPIAGDEILQGKEGDVKRAAENRLRKASFKATIADAEAINANRRVEREEREKQSEEQTQQQTHQQAKPQPSPSKELRLVIKGDVSGSIEALAAAAESIGNAHATTKVILSGVGAVTESDVMFAKASEAMIIAFNADVQRVAHQLALQHGVPVYSSNIIYSVLDKVKDEVIELLPKIIERRVTGEVDVLQIFDIKGKGKSVIKVAGCRVTNGVAERNKKVRVVRDGITIHEGTLSTLRILKKDVTEVKKGLECGMNITDFPDLRPGDFLQFYHESEKPGLL